MDAGLLYASLTGIFAGILSGMFGIGGGVVIVPFLIVFMGMGIHHACATSLAALLLPVGIAGVWKYSKSGHIRWIPAVWVTVGLISGVGFGAYLAQNVDAMMLKRLYGVFLMFICWRFWHPMKKMENTFHEPPHPRWWLLLGIGLTAGVLSGLFGIGGGVIVVPALVTLARIPFRNACATSLASLLLPVGLPGVLVHHQSGHIHYGVAAIIAGGLTAGTLLGATLSIRMQAGLIKRLYGTFAGVLGILMVVGWV